MKPSILRTVSTSGCCLPLTAAAALTAGQAAETMRSDLAMVVFDLRWALLFIVMLVVTDFWSGLSVSVKIRGEEFRLSRALRRSAAKFFEYVSFIMLGAVLLKSIGEPYGMADAARRGGALGAFIALYAEADSIYSHLCALHGFDKKVNVRRLLEAWLRGRGLK